MTFVVKLWMIMLKVTNLQKKKKNMGYYLFYYYNKTMVSYLNGSTIIWVH